MLNDKLTSAFFNSSCRTHHSSLLLQRLVLNRVPEREGEFVEVVGAFEVREPEVEACQVAVRRVVGTAAEEGEVVEQEEPAATPLLFEPRVCGHLEERARARLRPGRERMSQHSVRLHAR